MWGLWLDGRLLFSTSPASVKGKNLLRDPRVAVHLESGDEVVILEGEVDRVSIDEAIADAYEEKYAFRPDAGDAGGLWFALEPAHALAWLESDYPSTATRFDWDRR